MKRGKIEIKNGPRAICWRGLCGLVTAQVTAPGEVNILQLRWQSSYPALS